MAHKLTFAILVLVMASTVVAPFSYAKRSPAKAPKADVEGPGGAEAPEVATEGPAEAPKASAEGPRAATEWPGGGPNFVEFVIKKPFPAIPLSSSKSGNSDGLPVDPTPEGNEK
ncbi:hypothetical protein EJB05_48575, partial [Eragrostis curvula]